MLVFNNSWLLGIRFSWPLPFRAVTAFVSDWHYFDREMDVKENAETEGDLSCLRTSQTSSSPEKHLRLFLPFQEVDMVWGPIPHSVSSVPTSLVFFFIHHCFLLLGHRCIFLDSFSLKFHPSLSALYLFSLVTLYQEIHTSDESDCDDLDPKSGMEVWKEPFRISVTTLLVIILS